MLFALFINWWYYLLLAFFLVYISIQQLLKIIF